MSEPVLRVYLVRHGETNENRAGIIQGQMDTVLNEEGLIQACLCGEALKDVDFALAFSSDLKRTVQTAESILAHHPNTRLLKDEQLRERNMGELQGVRIGQYNRNKLPKSAETSELFTRRAIGWWMNAIERHLPSLPLWTHPLNVLVISHGAFITTLCRGLVTYNIVDTAPNMGFGVCYNTSVSTIAMRRNKRGTLEKFADISHLVGPVVTTNADEQPRGRAEE